MKNVPQLRFAGFEGEWEETKLSNIVKINSGRDYKHLSEGKYPVYGTGGLMTYVSDFLSDEDSVGIGRKGTINKPQKLEAPFWTVDTLFYSIPIKNYNLDYIYSLFQMINWLKYDESTGLPSLSKTNINNIRIYNTGVQEQEKIGELFRKIDALIEKQEGKVSKMEDFKKSMLQKMFPQKGQLVPDFRFEGFDGEWEKKKISDIGKISAGGDVDKKKIGNKGRYPVIANGDSNNGIIGYYEDHYKISEPAVTISARGNIGTAVARNYPFTPVIRVLTLTSDNNIYFMSEAINRLRIFNESSGVPQLTSPQFGGYNIFMTKLSEQEKIGQFFKNLDTQIETEEKLLESYKQMKKSLLQKMFV